MHCIVSGLSLSTLAAKTTQCTVSPRLYPGRTTHCAVSILKLEPWLLVLHNAQFPQPISPYCSLKLHNTSHQMYIFLLDHAVKLDLQELMFSLHECPFCLIGTTLMKHFSSVVIVTMPPKRVDSRDTIERSTKEVVEKALFNLKIYVDTQLFMEKVLTITW